MILNYIKVAWRTLWKNKAYSFINILGLALGIAVTMLIALWIWDELSYNSYFKNKDEIAQILQSTTLNGKTDTGDAIPRPLEFALREDYSSYFKHIVMSSWNYQNYIQYKDINIAKRGYAMQEGAPEMLDLEILQGVQNGLKDKKSVMIAQSTAKALFGNEDPIGKTLKFNNKDNLIVTAVFKDIPSKNNDFGEAGFIIPWKHYITIWPWIERAKTSWGNNSFQCFVQIADNMTMEQVTSKIKDVKKNKSEDEKEFNPQMFLHPMNDWHLRSEFKNGVQVGGRIDYVWLFGMIGFFVLILACINFMNLSTARSEKRAKEVGVRKSVGSTRGQLIRQFLSESFMIVCLSYLIAIIILLVSLESFNTLASKDIVIPWGNAMFWILSLVCILFTAFVSGSYPALYLSSFDPVKVLKGSFKAGKKVALPRKILVVSQFVISVSLIIGTIIVMQQVMHTKNRPIGYDKANLIQLPVMSGDFTDKYELLRNEFLNSKAIVEMSSSSSPMTDIWNNWGGFTWKGKPDGFQEEFAVMQVSFDYAKSLGLEIIEGRDFNREFLTDTNSILVNETAVRYMGLKNPLGTEIKDSDPDPGFLRKWKIIGVVKDVLMDSPYEPVKQTFFVFDKDQNANWYNLRLNPDRGIKENLVTIEKVFKKHFPSLPFQYEFVDENFAKKFASEERIASLAGMFTVLAIIISCLGLFGLASFVAEQRTKEIGIRKVLGASVFNLWQMLSKEFIILILISCLIAIPLSYVIMENWLQNYTYRTEIQLWIFMSAILGAILITLTTVSFQAIRAATSNPVKSLRTE